MVGRILRSADFERVLAHPARARSAHFALHHLAAVPSQPKARVRKAQSTELSTADAPACPLPVDDLTAAAPQGCWLGLVVPKRHARRAVTRNLIKRQMRALMQGAEDRLPDGLWVLRLKAPFDPRQFPSAASGPLRGCARAELSKLLTRVSVAGAAPGPVTALSAPSAPAGLSGGADSAITAPVTLASDPTRNLADLP